MPRVVHFDISADNPNRAVKFYSSVFGWKIEKWAGPMEYWMVTTGPADQPGIDGGIGKRSDPSEGIVNTIDVPSLEEFTAKVAKKGGKVLMPRMAIPGVGYHALCQDTEGNVFGMMQFDPSAK